MMAARLLVLVALVATVATTPPFCGHGQYGKLVGDKLALPPASLQPGVRDFQVREPDLSAYCPNGIRGVWAKACDEDSPPTVKFDSLDLFYTHRTGSLQYPGEVDVIAFCNPHLNSGSYSSQHVGYGDTNWVTNENNVPSYGSQTNEAYADTYWRTGLNNQPQELIINSY